MTEVEQLYAQLYGDSQGGVKTMQSPDGVSLLMENMWFRHRSGMKQSSDNVFLVMLPPHAEADINEENMDYTTDELFGAFI